MIIGGENRMRCNTLGVFVIGAVLGGAATAAIAVSDPVVRHRMCCKARKASRKAIRTAENWMR